MSPVFGADGTITGGAGTCTVDVLGVSDNNATANTIATWTLDEYECGAGQYLLNSDGTLECTECPVGSYCPGGKFTVESENNGTNACPTDYTSDAGATAENECYMGCELACSTNVECPPHSNNCTHSEFKTTGKQFSGSACNAYPSVCPIADFGCDTGYTKTTIPAMDIGYKYASFIEEHNGEDIFNVSLLLFCTLEGKDYTSPNYDGDNHHDRLINSISDCDFLTPGQMLLVSADMSFSFMVDISKNEYNGADIPGAIKLGEEEYSSPDYLLYNADFKPGVTGQGDKYWVRYSNIFLPTPDTEIIYRYISGELELPSDAADQEKLLAWLSTMFSSDLIKKIQQNPELIADESGMALLFASLRDIELPNTWISMNHDWFADAFFQYAFILWSWPLFGVIEAEAFEDNPEQGLEAVFGGASYCNNNTINIDWNPDNGGEHIQNMCYYDGAVTLPSDPVKPGYTFTGWKLVE